MATMTKCGYSKRYKGRKEPRCSCDYCQMVWEREEMRREMQHRIDELLRRVSRLEDPHRYYV